MSKLLEAWLNSDVQLSKRITDFEEDFANGYMFGELLHKFNQQYDFEDFANRQTRQHILSNFARMVDTFRDLKIKLDHHTIDQIIKKTPGVALNLLYRLKMSLDQTAAPTEIRNAGRVSEQPPIKTLRPTRPKYDALDKTQFKRRLHSLHIPESDVLLDAKLQKYSDFRRSVERKAALEAEEDNRRTLRARNYHRNSRLERLQHNAKFLEEWEQRGMENWRHNMEQSLRRERLQLSVQLTRQSRLKAATDMQFNKSLKQTFEGIERFENTMLEYGLPIKPYKEIPEPVEVYKAELPSHVQQARDYRRKTMCARLFQLETARHSQQKETAAVQRLDAVADAELELEHSLKTISKYTGQCIASRTHKSARMDAIQQREADQRVKRQQAYYDRALANARKETDLELEKAKRLTVEMQTACRGARFEELHNLTELIINIAEEVYAFQQATDSAETDPRFWAEWLEQFKEGQSTTPTCHSELNVVALNEYIYAKGQWQYPGAVEALHLSEALEAVSAWGIEVEPTPHTVPPGELRLCIVGYPFAGKRLQAAQLKTVFELDVIEPSEVLEESALQTLGEGLAVSDAELAAALAQKVQHSKAWVILDFPNTLSQAELFEQALSGPEPPKDLVTTRIEQARQIVHFNQCEQVNTCQQSSCIQKVLWIQTDKAECLRRCMGRREFQQSLFHLEDSSSIDPYSYEGMKPYDNWARHRSNVVNRMVAADFSLPVVASWYSQFEDTVIEPVNGNQTAQAITEKLVPDLQELRNKALQTLLQFDQAEEGEAEEDEEEARARRREQILMQDEDEKSAAFTLPKAAGAVESRPETIEGIWEVWETTQHKYQAVLLAVLQQERQQRLDFATYLKDFRDDFITFLGRPCAKQELLTQFQWTFNQFSDEFPDAREDPAVIAELHQRTDDLGNALCDNVDTRLADALTEVDAVSKSGWLEEHVSLVVTQVQSVALSEYYRYLASCQILVDYYCSLEQKKLPKAPVAAKIDVPVETLGANEAIEKLTDKLAGLPAFTAVYEEEKDSRVKRKDTKGRKVEEEKVEKSPQQLQMEEGLKNEHALFVYRVKRLQHWGKARIKEMTDSASKLFEHLSQWASRAAKAETNAVLAVLDLIRSHIEDQSKLRPYLRISSFDLTVCEDLLTYEVFEKPPLDPKESRSVDRLPVPMLESMHQQLSLYPPIVPKDLLVNVLTRIKKVSQVLDAGQGFSEKWLRFDKGDFYRILNVFDTEATGFVDWRNVLNSLILVESTPVQSRHIQQILTNLPNEVTLELWVQTPMWFDRIEQNVDEPDAIPYDRLAAVKTLLFAVNCEQGQLTVQQVRDLFTRMKPLKSFL